MSVHIWTPGIAGPLDELVARLVRMVESFTQEHELAHAEVRVELLDGSRHLLAAASSEPGFGFFSFTPHRAGGEPPGRLIVPIGAVKSIEISAPDPEQPFGFTASA